MYRKAGKNYGSDKYKERCNYSKKCYSHDYNNEYDYELVGCYLKESNNYYGYKKHDGCRNQKYNSYDC